MSKYARLGVSPPRRSANGEGSCNNSGGSSGRRENLIAKKKRSIERASMRREKKGMGGGDFEFDDVKSEGEMYEEETTKENAKLRDAKRMQMLKNRLDKLKSLPKQSKYAKTQIELVNKCLDMIKVALRSEVEEDEITRLMHSVSLR